MEQRTGQSYRPWPPRPGAPSRVPCRRSTDEPGRGPPRPGGEGRCADGTTSSRARAHYKCRGNESVSRRIWCSAVRNSDFQLWCLGTIERREPAIARNVPLFTNTLEISVETVGHYGVHTEHVLPWLETAGRDIPLEIEREQVSHELLCGGSEGIGWP